MRCDYCLGNGYIKLNNSIHFCKKCRGTGELTFVENVFEKKLSDEDYKIRSKNYDKFKRENIYK